MQTVRTRHFINPVPLPSGSSRRRRTLAYMDPHRPRGRASHLQRPQSRPQSRSALSRRPPKLRPAVYEVTECAPHQAFTWIQKPPAPTNDRRAFASPPLTTPALKSSSPSHGRFVRARSSAVCTRKPSPTTSAPKPVASRTTAKRSPPNPPDGPTRISLSVARFSLVPC